MTRILVISDMHTEFWKGGNQPNLLDLPSPESYDVVVAAGDIGVGISGLTWLAETFPQRRIIYVPGNHEYYRQEYHGLNDLLAEHAQWHDIDLLNPGTVMIGDVTFIGANLWTDFELRGYLPMQEYNLQGFADFSLIRVGEERMSLSTMKQIHQLEKAYIINELEAIDDNSKTVVITHFVPSQLCVHQKWVGNSCNPYFTNDLDDLFDKYQYPLHLFGHTHDRHDVDHPLGTRLVSNPLGYPRENRERFEWKIVEL